ncbi:caspase-9-like [Argopecten irradians]|uniref:caspase-9-like n=1 Tax=Argopecten irradians TaxID=31199 RepID=UPI0037236313
MAEEKWKQGIRENWSAITSSLGNPEELLEYLYHKVSPPLINEDQFREIKVFTIFDCHNERKGSDLDRDKLSRVLCQLHFSVKIYNNLNSADMLRIAEESSHWVGHRNSNCCVFTILTHGCQQGVYGTDGGVVRVNDIVKNFNSINCPELKGKPKIFLFQSCRNSEDEKQNKSEGPKPNSTGVSPEDMEEEEDTSKAFDNVPNDLVVEDSAVAEGPKHKIQRQPSESHEHSDFFFGYATPEGFRSYRQEKRGSWFIQAIVWVLKYNSHQEHILDLMTKLAFIANMNANWTEANSMKCASASC